MNNNYRLLPASWLLLPAFAFAQNPQTGNAAEAQASVPAPAYYSTFKDYRTAVEDKQTPDEVWRAANEEVRAIADAGHTSHGSSQASNSTDKGEGERQGMKTQSSREEGGHGH